MCDLKGGDGAKFCSFLKKKVRKKINYEYEWGACEDEPCVSVFERIHHKTT